MKWPLRVWLMLLIGAAVAPFPGMLAYRVWDDAEDSARRVSAGVTLAAGQTAQKTAARLEALQAQMVALAQRPKLAALDPNDCDPLFSEGAALFPQLTNVSTLDADGDVVCSIVAPAAGGPTRVDPKYYLAEALRTRSFTVGRPAQGFLTGRWVVTLALPILDKTGNVAGVLAFPIDLVNFWEGPDTLEVPAPGRVRIFDDEGTILASSEEPAQWVGQKARPHVVQRALADESMSTNDTDRFGVERFYGVTRVPGVRWYVSVGVPSESVFGPSRRAAAQDAAMALAITLAGLALAWAVARRIAGPVEQAATVLQRWASGGVRAGTVAVGPAEVVALADEFNRALEALERASAELKTSVERSQAILRTAPDGMLMADRDGRLVEANEALSGMTGYRAAELLAMRVDDLELQAAPEGFATRFSQAAVTGGARFESEWRRKDGTAVPVEISAQLLPGPEEFIVAFVRDITQRRQVEAQIVRHRRELETTVAERTAALERARTLMAEGERLANLGTWEYVVATQETFWSEGECRIYGVDARQKSPDYGGMLRQHIHPDDAAELDRVFGRALANGEPYELEHRIVRPDGTIRHVRNLGHPYFDAAGKVVRFVGTTLDITETKAAAVVLERTLEMLKLATDGARIGTWYWTLPGDRLEWSDRCKELLALPPGQEPSFDRFYAAMHPDDRATVERLIADAVERRADYAAEYRIVHADAEVRWVAALGRVYSDADGSLRGMGGVVLDITDRKDAQARIEAQARNVNLLNVELARRAEAAEIANRAKTAFLAVMSHELRTPLNGIMGMTELALRRVDDPKVVGYLTKAQAASTHLLGVLADILDTARIEAEELSLVDEPFTFDAVTDRLLSLQRPAAADKGLALNVALDPALAGQPLVGDPLRLSQILNNLVGNAIKFTQAGAIEVRAQVAAEGQADLLLRVEVQDTGMGIAAEDQKRLFRPFEQVDMSLTRRFGGSGLGLYICRRLAERMGGEIGVHSTPGSGSTFWFTVRVKRGAGAVTPDAPATSLEAESELKRLHGGARVLVVEDEALNRFYASDLLAQEGLDVDMAENGAEAVARVQASDYDAILMDVKMPVMDGLEAARRIRALPGREHVPILAMTALAYPRDRALCLAAGMDDCLVKPFEIGALCELLLKWLGRAR